MAQQGKVHDMAGQVMYVMCERASREARRGEQASAVCRGC